MTRFAMIFSVVTACFLGVFYAESPDRSEQLPMTYKIRDAQTAKKAAEDYFTNQGPEWAQKNRPYRADAAFYTRSPESLGTALKKGDPIWVVDVLNDAQSIIRFRTPVGIVWVRAEDGAVFVVTPKKDLTNR